MKTSDGYVIKTSDGVYIKGKNLTDYDYPLIVKINSTLLYDARINKILYNAEVDA